jgi:hypothetical protein
LICPCFNGKHYSLTIRINSDKLKQWKAQKPLGTLSLPNEKQSTAPALSSSGFRLPEDLSKEGEKFIIQADKLCSVFCDQVFPSKPDHMIDASSGLVIVASETNAGKTVITKGIIHHYLSRLARADSGDRRPHLVTYEDPIEETLFAKSPADASAIGVDYTPREKGVDADKLRAALLDALRQTPTVFYVGEVREQEDWLALIDFAGSGHLVVATAHAGSLVESLKTVFKAARLRTPTDRSHTADRIRGIIHLETMKIDGKKITLPALWRNTSNGVNALVSDGLASVIPHNADLYYDADFSSLGKTWFTRMFLSEDFKPNLTHEAQGFLQGEQRAERIHKHAILSDLKGV